MELAQPSLVVRWVGPFSLPLNCTMPSLTSHTHTSILLPQDGLVQRLVGPFSNDLMLEQPEAVTFERVKSEVQPAGGQRQRLVRVSSASGSYMSLVTEAEAQGMMDTAAVGQKVMQHVAWSNGSGVAL